LASETTSFRRGLLEVESCTAPIVCTLKLHGSMHTVASQAFCCPPAACAEPCSAAAASSACFANSMAVKSRGAVNEKLYQKSEPAHQQQPPQSPPSYASRRAIPCECTPRDAHVIVELLGSDTVVPIFAVPHSPPTALAALLGARIKVDEDRRTGRVERWRTACETDLSDFTRRRGAVDSLAGAQEQDVLGAEPLNEPS